MRESSNNFKVLRFGALLLGISLALLISGCSSSRSTVKPPPPSGSVNFIYTANAGGGSGTAAALISDANSGSLTSITGSPFPTGNSSFALATDPGGKFLYVVNYFSGDISGFSISPTTGALSPLAASPVAAELGVDALAIDPTGKFLYAVSERSANLYEFSIDAAGALQALASSPVSISAGTTASRAIAIDPSGNYLFVSAEDSTTDNLYVFTRDLNAGTLTPPVAPISIDVGAHAITTDPAGKFVLISSSGSSTLFGDLSVLSLDATTGALTPVTGSPFRTGVDPASVAVDPSGKFVYTANTADSTISGFSLDSTTGTLTSIPGSPFASRGVGTINGPTGIVAEPSGRFVYTCNSSNDISGFQINAQSGVLTSIPGSPFASGGNGPHGIAAVKKK